MRKQTSMYALTASSMPVLTKFEYTGAGHNYVVSDYERLV